MFYCDLCADARSWPTTLFQSYGSCEACGKARMCNEAPSSVLPIPAPAEHLGVSFERAEQDGDARG